MLRKGGATLLSRALQQSAGLVQQPQNSVQQPCVQLLQVLNLQAVRFRSKQSSPKYRDSLTRADKAAIARAKALDRATAAAQAAGLLPAPAASLDVPASQASSSSGGTTPAVSDGQAGASAAAASSTSTSSSSSSWTPQWLRDLVGDTRRRRSRGPPPVQASPLTPAAATRDSAAKQRTDEKQQAMAKSRGMTMDGKEAEPDTDPYAADGWGPILAQYADYSLDEFAEQIKNDPKSDSFEAPPRPMTPLRGPFARYGNVFDYKRVTYWRFETLYNVMRAMSPEDKLAVKLNPHFANDQKAMQELADRVGTEADVLRDVFHMFNKQKRQFALLTAHRSKGGAMPAVNDQHALRITNERLVKQDEQDKLKTLWKLRDPHKCELRRAAALATKADMRRICPQTQLHYSECCGRKNRLNAKGLLKAKRKLLRAA